MKPAARAPPPRAGHRTDSAPHDAAVLLSVAVAASRIAALSLRNDADTLTTIRHLVREMGIDPSHRLVDGAISKVSGLGHRRLEALSVGTFVYAAVFLVEGTGLLLRKRWAEYLTVLVGGAAAGCCIVRYRVLLSEPLDAVTRADARTTFRSQ